MSNHKIHVHPDYACQMTRIAALLEADFKAHKDNPTETMLWINSVEFAVEGDDKVVARLVPDPELDYALVLEFTTKEWGV